MPIVLLKGNIMWIHREKDKITNCQIYAPIIKMSRVH